MLVISTREFRSKQSKYLDLARNGEDVVLKSREKGSFKLIPVVESDTIVNKEVFLKPDEDLAKGLTIEQLLPGIEEDVRLAYRKKYNK